MVTRWVLLLLLIPVIIGCGDKKQQFEFAGGKLRFCISTPILTTNLNEVSDYNSQLILGQIYEGLISLDPNDLTPKPQLASSYQIKNDGLTYEFTLRKGVYFVNSEGDKVELKPSDVVYSIQKACSPIGEHRPRAYFMVFQNSLEGADEYFAGKANNISGINVKGNKITFQLLKPDNNFLARLSLPFCAIVSEKLDQKSHLLSGTGPFLMASEKPSNKNIVLLKNPDYYLSDKQGNALPYLDSLEFIVNSKKLQQLDLFEQKQTDLILGLPTSRITRMIEGRLSDFNSEPPLLVLHSNPQLVTNYYLFNMQDPRFSDKRVRQAFNYAINREVIGNEILRNQYYELGYYGFVPPVRDIFRGYDFGAVKKHGYYFNPDLAKKLLADAGFPNGEGFGTVTIRYDIDDVHSAIASEIAMQIESNLGIKVNMDASSFQQLRKDEISGNGEIFRFAWSADFPSPETFLANFYGKYVPKDSAADSPINHGRYINQEFDRLYEQAKSEEKLAKRRTLFSQAEEELLKDPPGIPLWYNGEMQITYSKVRNLQFNAMDMFSFREVYIKDWTKEEYLESRKK